MQGYLRILFLLGIIILFTIHWYAFPLKEGFFDVGSDYENLKIRLKNELGDYCATSEFVRSQIQQMQQHINGKNLKKIIKKITVETPEYSFG